MTEYTTTEQKCTGCMGPCGQCDPVQIYLAAVTREIQKRVTTYPKIIAKKKKQGMPPDELLEMMRIQEHQVARLMMIEECLKAPIDFLDTGTAVTYLDELKREMKMRKKYYPRLIYFKRIKPETAEYEIAVWADLIVWFNEKYIGLCSPS